MDPNMNTNLQGNEAPPQQVYLIQLDPNVQIESQAIPLHILENNIDGDLILPLLQQKQGQPLLFIEPLKEPRVATEYQKTQAGNKMSHIAHTSSGFPVISFNNDKREPNLNQNHILSSTINKQNITMASSLPSDVINLKEEKATKTKTVVKIEPGSTKDFEVEIKIDKIYPTPKQKIKNYVHISDVKAPPRALAVLPAALQIRGKYISPRRTLSARIRFGPVQGVRRTITRSEAKILSSEVSPIFLINQDGDHVIHIDVTDKDKSNWIGLLPLGEPSSLPSLSTANVWLYEESNELYLLTVQPIFVRRPLRLGYGKKYVEDHGLKGAPVLDLETVNPVQWWCNECHRALPTAAVLQRHTDVYHKDDYKSWRSTYRCRYCKRPFGRLFTLKRHMLIHCLKKPQSPEKPQQLIEPNPEPDISSALEDNRIPSDESFQNFANSLDFSTNLFDTDRIAGLDISGHSRVDSELNSYSIGFRDENGLSNDLGFTKLTNGLDNVQSNETNRVTKEPLLENCAFCSQVVVKENKSKHLRQCPSRLICECGRVFRHKQSLARHIRKCHPSEKPIKDEKEETSKKKPEDEKELAYKCQECSVGFKRRGMLVNHLWRIHKMISTLPVEKRVRHYPCVACNKIYRSATKRDVHVRVHHPGVEKVRGLAIEGGVKSCQAASCTECFRQYATRAKLLQHIRAQHPNLAKVTKKPPVKKQTKSKAEDKVILNFLITNHE